MPTGLISIPGTSKPLMKSISRMLVPIISNADMEKMATSILAEYYPEALKSPMPIDVHVLAERIGLTFKEARLSRGKTIFGQRIFFKGAIKTREQTTRHVWRIAETRNEVEKAHGRRLGKSQLSPKTIQRKRNEPDHVWDLETIVAMCIRLQIPGFVSTELVKKTGQFESGFLFAHMQGFAVI